MCDFKMLAVWIVLLAGGIGGAARGQSVTLTGPGAPVVVEDGEDFATDALGRQWNMDRLRDIAFDYGFAQPTAAGGVWQAQAAGSMAYYQPLFQGLNEPTYSIYFSRYDEGTPYGPLNPIEAGKYTRLSLRASLPTAARSFLYGFWTTDHRYPPVSNGFALQDNRPAVQGFRMYDIDLTGNTWQQGKVAGMAPALSFIGVPWQGLVKGLMLRPAEAPAVGTLHKVDWIRIYDPTTSPTLTITWNTSSVPGDGNHAINLYVDTDASGFDGDLFISALANDGSHTIHTAALPPGVYYFYLKVQRQNGGTLSEIATSGYSAALTIRAPPSVGIRAPSYTSGEDYATSVLGNPWDISNNTDVPAVSDITFPSFSGGLLTGFAGVTDPQIHLNMKKAGTLMPIDPKKYRYLTFRMRADETGFVNYVDRVANGWVARVIWWNDKVTTDGTVSKDIPLLEGFHRYTIDMWDQGFVETKPSGAPQRGWRVHPQVRGFRIDPLEVFKTTRFDLDDVRLCAENRPTNGFYTVQWDLSDVDSATVAVKVFYGYEKGSGYVEVPTPLVQRAAAVPGPDAYAWDMRQFANGRYFLRFEVDDGDNVRSFMSEVPIIVESGFPRMDVAGMDPTVYFKPAGSWYTLRADGTGYTHVQWGGATADPVAADYDGDGVMDRAVFHSPSGNWYVRQSSSGTIMGGGPIKWGPSAVPVPADYDGDHRADLAVYAPSDGKWYVRQSSTGTMLGGAAIAWGPYAVPVQGDYDGDGLADVAVYAPSDSKWYIRRTSTGTMFNGAPITLGVPNSKPVPADYDGDGKTDLAVYVAGPNVWHVRLSTTGNLMGGAPINWGAANSVPVAGDYDDDGKADIVVFSPSDGYWSFLFSGGGSETAGPWGWGGASSIPVAGDFTP